VHDMEYKRVKFRCSGLFEILRDRGWLGGFLAAKQEIVSKSLCRWEQELLA
jgi:hypothetical protein